MNIKKRAVLIGMLLASMVTNAGTQTGTVVQLNSRSSDGLTYFELSGAGTNKPSCATHSYWMILDENSERGKKLFALLLAAQATGKQVTVWGTNTCTRWGDGEDVNLVSVEN